MSRLTAAMQGPAAKEVSAYERFRARLNLIRTDVSALVGEKNVDRFVRVTLNAVQSNPKTLQADQRSLFLACLKAAQDGLLPDGREAVFNIYSTKVKEGNTERWVDVVQYMPMAYGLIQKIYEAGATYVDAVAVYERDKFEYQRGDDPKIIHVPYDGDEEPGKVKAAYVVVKLKTGETKREVMFHRDIERVRQKSKAPNGLMWKDFFDQGAIKSVIHRVVKQLPRASENDRLQATLAHDHEAVGLAEVEVQGTGTNLEALIDGRLDQQLRDSPIAGTKVETPKEDAFVGAGGTSGGTTVAAGGPVAGSGGGADIVPPKKGEAGTPELKKKIIAGIESAKDLDVLGIKRDEANFFTWTVPDVEEINAAYEARKSALSA